MKDLIVSFVGLKREVTDISKYEECIGGNIKAEYFDKMGVDDSIFPEKIKVEMEVEEFKFVFENIADPQYLSYLTVEYSDSDYIEEISRLEQKGVDEYIGFYEVTGAPEGYKVIAMELDSSYGFVYAIIPIETSNSITYVEAIFCNYFLDLDIHEYVPQEYILQGFDAEVENSYRNEKLD